MLEKLKIKEVLYFLIVYVEIAFFFFVFCHGYYTKSVQNRGTILSTISKAMYTVPEWNLVIYKRLRSQLPLGDEEKQKTNTIKRWNRPFSRMTNRPRYTERDLFRPMNRLPAIDGFHFFFSNINGRRFICCFFFKRYWESEKLEKWYRLGRERISKLFTSKRLLGNSTFVQPVSH